MARAKGEVVVGNTEAEHKQKDARMKPVLTSLIAVAVICLAGCVTNTMRGPRGQVAVKVPANAQIDKSFNVIFSEVGGVGVTLTNTVYLVAEIMGNSEADLDTGLLGPRVLRIPPDGEVVAAYTFSRAMLLAKNHLREGTPETPYTFLISYKGCDDRGHAVRFDKQYEMSLQN